MCWSRARRVHYRALLAPAAMCCGRCYGNSLGHVHVRRQLGHQCQRTLNCPSVSRGQRAIYAFGMDHQPRRPATPEELVIVHLLVAILVWLRVWVAWATDVATSILTRWDRSGVNDSEVAAMESVASSVRHRVEDTQGLSQRMSAFASCNGQVAPNASSDWPA